MRASPDRRGMGSGEGRQNSSQYGVPGHSSLKNLKFYVQASAFLRAFGLQFTAVVTLHNLSKSEGDYPPAIKMGIDPSILVVRTPI